MFELKGYVDGIYGGNLLLAHAANFSAIVFGPIHYQHRVKPTSVCQSVSGELLTMMCSSWRDVIV